ncbi:MAG: DNA primase [Flavobacteriales bacterium]|nr:DNA primase [Flavobacteriales bacterium]NUM51427.1 DNA primase [Flavobacteriales bacterium]
MISKNDIDKIFEAALIEEVVGDFVVLKKRGTNLLGLCPFHNEKTPSFTVSPAKGIYKCFGCGKAGNSVNFVMEHEHYSYPEALKYLARKYNIEIEEAEATPEQLIEENTKESLMVVSHFAWQFFTERLHHTDEGKSVGLSYLRQRGFRDDIIEKFGLGYSPDARDALYTSAVSVGHNPSFLEKTGLCIKKETAYIDRFRARVIFPIHNQTGRVIGFGGRALKKEEKAKYINSPESEIYNKSKVLYGLFFAKKSIIVNNNCFLVEGYTDVISFVQAGIENVVSSSGTSLTTEQIRLIKRFTNNITILYDGDAAGIKASFRGIDMILEEGMNVRVVLFPDGNDPDSYARMVSTEELKKYITENTQDFIRFKTNILNADVANDPIKKSELIKDIVTSVSCIPDPIYRSVYIKECASLLQAEEQALLSTLNRIRKERINKKVKQQGSNELEELPDTFVPVTTPANDGEPENHILEKDLIRILLSYGHKNITIEKTDERGLPAKFELPVAHYIINDLTNDEIELAHTLYSKMFCEYKSFTEQNKLPSEHYFTQHPDADICTAAVNIISQPYRLSDKWEKKNIFVVTEEDMLHKTVHQVLYALKLKEINKMLKDIEIEIKNTSNEEALFELLNKYKSIKDIQQELAEALGGRIILK